MQILVDKLSPEFCINSDFLLKVEIGYKYHFIKLPKQKNQCSLHVGSPYNVYVEHCLKIIPWDHSV